MVNKDRIPPEVITEIMKAWEEYIAAFAEDALATMEGLVSKRAEEL